MDKKRQYCGIMFGILFMVLLFAKHTLVVQAASQSITMTVGGMRSIYENSYSEGTKTWTVGDSSVISLEYASNTSRILYANKVGSTTITIKTVYTAWEPTYNAATGMWLSTPVSKTSYFTYYVTVVEEGEATPVTINTIDDNYDLSLSSKTCVVLGTVRDTLEFESSDSSVISVDGHGVLLAKKKGSVTITITDPYGLTKEVPVNAVTQEEMGYNPISSIEELNAIPSEASGNYYLTEDLDFTGYSGSFSIESFAGTFDGAGHTIKGYKNSTALFSKALNATIRNLTMEDAVIDGNGNDMAAIVCTGNGCTISNCHTVNGTVENTTNAGGVFTSPIAAYNKDGRIEFCTNSASVQGSEVAGGIAGHTIQEIRWCTNKGAVATTNTSSVTWGCAGGIVGLGLSEYNSARANYYQPIRYCLNEGNIQSVTAGGIAGRLYGSTLDQCSNKGTISSLPATLSSSRTTNFSSSYGHLGGILGMRMVHYNAMGSYIRDCYNQGTIAADDTSYVVVAGGITGCLTLSDSYSVASIQNTYSTASVTHTKNKSDSCRGGIAGIIYLNGYCGSTVINSYTNDSTTVEKYSVTNSGKNVTSNVNTLSDTGQYNESNYVNFDFGNIWTMTPDGISLPYLAIEDKAYNALNLSAQDIVVHNHSFNEQGICQECGMISIDKHAEIEIMPEDVIYSGEEQTASVRITYQGTELVSGTDYEISSVKETYAGTYDVEVTGKGSYADSATVTWEIKKKEVIPSVTGLVSKTYDGTTNVPEDHTLAVFLEGIVAGDDVTATAEFVYDDMNAGTQKSVTANQIILEGDDKDNYGLSATTASAGVGRIEQRETSIAFKNYNPDRAYTGKALENPTEEQLAIEGATYKDVDFIWYQDSEALENRLTTAPKDAGTYVLVAELSETTNTLASSVKSNAITITKADPEYTEPSDLTAICGDTLSSVSLEGTGFSWLDGTEKLTADSDLEAAREVVCTAVYTPADKKNYNTLDISLTVMVAHELSAEHIGEGRHASKCINCSFQNNSVACSGGEATCSSKAVCAVCHTAYGGIDDQNHKWDAGKVTKAATCTHEGEKTFTCEYDNMHTKTETIAINKNAHDYGSWQRCDEKRHKRVCVNDSTHIDYANHKFVEKIDKPATASEDGSKHEECAVCGYKKCSVRIPATGVPKEGTSFLDTKTGGCYVVADSGKKQVEYTGPVDKNAKKVSIPDTITWDGITYKVTAIAEDAFKNNKKITSVTIGSNVTTIGNSAFYGCKKVKKVTIGKGVTTIGANAFSGCSKLKTLSMGSGIIIIGDKAFYKCTTLNRVTIPAKVTKIGKQAFYGCKKLKTITIKTTKLTSRKVGSKAFKGTCGKAVVKVPKSKLSSYKKWLKSKGISSKAKIKK